MHLVLLQKKQLETRGSFHLPVMAALYGLGGSGKLTTIVQETLKNSGITPFNHREATPALLGKRCQLPLTPAPTLASVHSGLRLG